MSPPDVVILTGAHLVETVLRHGQARPSEIAVLRGGSARGLSRMVGLAESLGITVSWLEEDGMRELAGEPVEIAAALPNRTEVHSQDMLTDDAAPLFAIAVEGVEDPHNLGDILRTAFAAGVDFAILGPHAATMPRLMLARNSAGASECLPLVFSHDLAEELETLRAHGVAVCAATCDDGENLFEADFPARVAFVVGGEHRGVSKHVLDRCSRHINVPMSRAVQSLSAPASAAVILLEAARRRKA